MALTAIQLRDALRLGDSAAETAQATRLLGAANAMVRRVAPVAPSEVQDEAVVRFAGYLFDSPTGARGAGYAAAWRNSGAAALCEPWATRRAEVGAARGGGEAPAIGEQAVTEDKIADGAITARKLSDGLLSQIAVRLQSANLWTATTIRALFHPWASEANVDPLPISKIPRLNDSKLPQGPWLDGARILRDSIYADVLRDGVISTRKLADRAVTRAKLAADAIPHATGQAGFRTSVFNAAADELDFGIPPAPAAAVYVFGPCVFSPRIDSDSAIGVSLVHNTGSDAVLVSTADIDFSTMRKLTNNTNPGYQRLAANGMPDSETLHIGSWRLGAFDDAVGDLGTRFYLQAVTRSIPGFDSSTGFPMASRQVPTQDYTLVVHEYQNPSQGA